MTAVPPADRIAAATTSSEQATATGPTPAAIARRQTWTIIGASPIGAMGLPGRRVEAIRAGIRIIGVISASWRIKPPRRRVDAGVATPYGAIKFLGSAHGQS
jgi:hypothetical protein